MLVNMEWDAEMLLDAKVAETWIKGKRVYRLCETCRDGWTWSRYR